MAMSLSENPQHFFEGAEKLLEISYDHGNEKDADLRLIPRNLWEKLLKTVKCEIISFTKNDSIDAYVLSESSMFVFRHRWILKTCGTTTPLHCLKGFLQIAEEYGFTDVSDVFYSRKNFVRPEMQLFPHRGFCEEVDFLESIFDYGRSYCLGSINRECWYLYTFSKDSKKPIAAISDASPDQTIEILMQNLDKDVMAKFTNVECVNGNDATMKTGIDKIIPDMIIDDFLFDPCGYSMNGIRKNGEYMTIHITPENTFSYVSFESNVAMDNYTDLINRVIRTFKPSKFIVTIFANEASTYYATLKELELEYTKFSNWKRTDIQCCNFPSYNLLFAQYTKERKDDADNPAN